MTTLLLNGRVHSPSHPDATAMAVRDGVVAWLGSDDIGRAQFPGARTVDLDGCFVAPAFVDSHIHLTATGLLRTGLDLSSATSRRIQSMRARSSMGEGSFFGAPFACLTRSGTNVP